MLALENFGVVELSAQEAQTVEGGLIWVVALVALYLWGEYYQSSHGMAPYGAP